MVINLTTKCIDYIKNGSERRTFTMVKTYYGGGKSETVKCVPKKIYPRFKNLQRVTFLFFQQLKN